MHARAVWLTSAFLAATLPQFATAQEPQLIRKQHYSPTLDTEREYWLYLPRGFRQDGQEKWPILMFLHGGGERGNQIELVLRHGPIKEVVLKRRDLPFIIIAPQMPEFSEEEQKKQEAERAKREAEPKEEEDDDERLSLLSRPTGKPWKWGPLGPPEGWHAIQGDLLQMVDNAIAEYQGDPDRVYLTGLSYGGFGTWYMATHHPQRWAAVAPICGAGENDLVHRIGQLPVWLFQGGRDTVVLAEWSLATADALDEAGGNVRVTVHEELGHDSWTRPYAGQELYDWFLSHRRGGS